MKKVFRRFLSALICWALLAATFAPACALEGRQISDGEAAAQELYELGLFRGVGTLGDGSPDFALGQTATRAQAVTMLVRLLGGEAEAEQSRYRHPFTDAGWADAYIGYAYNYSITNGVSDTIFGRDEPVSAEQFLTLVLRALGRNVADWHDPFSDASDAGLYCPSGEGFLRADIACVCLSALDCEIEGEGITLRERLEAEGALGGSPADGASELAFGPVTDSVASLAPANADELLPLLVKAVDGRAASIEISVPAGKEGEYTQYIFSCLDALSGARGCSCSWSIGGRITVAPQYTDASEAMAYLEGKRTEPDGSVLRLLEAARSVHDSLVTEEMSADERVKAFHDYIINRTEYGWLGEQSFDAAGVFFDGTAVCEGYANAMDLLCYLSGIECIQVKGGDHAWNKVKLDGQWYNVDATFDDPVSDRPVLLYDYFLVSDDVIAADHTWTRYAHLPPSPSSYNR